DPRNRHRRGRIERGDRLGARVQHARSLAIGAHAEWIGAVDLEHRGQRGEDLGDVGVGHAPIRLRNVASSITAMPSFFASSSLEPAPGPATTRVTFWLRLEATRAPATSALR